MKNIHPHDTRAHLVCLTVVLGSAMADPAHAYSSRAHMVVANQVRQALIESSNGEIPLLWSGSTVRIPEPDLQAILLHPDAFRGGAVAPDILLFPAVTDATHAAGQDPYGQCELLYEEAVTEQERAFALGCLLHGANDAVSHHFVNFFTGETFTLYPISEGREQGFDNVVGHLVTEGAIQSALMRADPSLMAAGALTHTIPSSFVLRTYFDTRSPLWLRLSKSAREELEQARLAMPEASLATVVACSGFGPNEHLALAPLYLQEIEQARVDLRSWMEAEIADMQDPLSDRGFELWVAPGDDGVLGTWDDETDCAATCPTLFAEYHLYVRLLEPRQDAGGRELPSAFDKISDQLGDDLRLVFPALVETITSLSAALNGPMDDPGDHGYDLDPATIASHFEPLRLWAARVVALDYSALIEAVVPSWLLAVDDFFDGSGVAITIPDLVAFLFEPLADQVRGMMESYVLGAAEEQLRALLEHYEQTHTSWEERIQSRLQAAAPDGAQGTALDHILSTGLWAHSFNLGAAALANHSILLSTDPISDGPASFDASFTQMWTQPALCDYLRDHVFPEGMTMSTLLSLRLEDGFHRASGDEDSPIECHDGSLFDFALDPTVPACAPTTVEMLQTPPHRGSVSRAFPPELAGSVPGCAYLTVPGLPAPQTSPDAGPDGGDADAESELPEPDGDPWDGGSDSGDSATSSEPSGGGCSASPGSPATPLWAAMGLMALFRRRKHARRILHLASCCVVLALVSCAQDPATDSDADLWAPPDSGVPDDGGPQADRDVPHDGRDPVDVDGDLADDPWPDGDTLDSDGPDMRRALLAELAGTVWSSRQSRTESAGLIERAYEIRFNTASLEWAEIQNPFGPARMRTLRSFAVSRDGQRVTSVILSPAGWPVHPRNGDRESFLFEVLDGAPKALRITNLESAAVEQFAQGPWPEPEGGLTAEVRVFEPGGAIDQAFCEASLGAIERQKVWSFARGLSSEQTLRYDVVAGVPINDWDDGPHCENCFSVTDVAGFDRLGGTLLSDQLNFIVRYTGTVSHPGGELSMRERDDAVEDVVWAFLDGGVGSARLEDLFLEVHGFIWADHTVDEPGQQLDPAEIPIEIMMMRCAEEIEEMAVEIRLGDGTFRSLDRWVTTPQLGDDLFPPAL